MDELTIPIRRPLDGQIALVTGASRGIGRGIALQLGRAGATVYITGRSPTTKIDSTTTTELEPVPSGLPSLEQTANEIVDLGGKSIAVYCDHSSSSDVENLFHRIEAENGGALDILVNNANSGISSILENSGKKFFECPTAFWDEINDVGLRNFYVCCCYAARLMVKRKKGLILNISSGVGLRSGFGPLPVPYEAGKAAIDRMSCDMSRELKEFGITMCSIWPGVVQTELLEEGRRKGQINALAKLPVSVVDEMIKNAETPEFVGKAIVALAKDENRLKKAGKILLTSDLAREYRFKDAGDRMPTHLRSARLVLLQTGWLRLARFVPEFVLLPKKFVHFGSYNF